MCVVCARAHVQPIEKVGGKARKGRIDHLGIISF